ncbi:hypothetical protein R3W88_031641 [Solanum pinnatisectum]|uniref:Uncharacterized protein n=1 Tax=Solanum pinnatisectum TaxID=50273 RepID=A0AAV9LQE4_9SOLN|nr:hypothetical protein R3W88_031641 [Solanum pinnatisectum]
MSQIVDSHSTPIKQLEQQLGQLSTLLNQRKNGTLPSNTIQNPKKDVHYMEITTRSGKSLPEPKLDSFKQEESIKRDEEPEVDVEIVDDLDLARKVEKRSREKEAAIEVTFPLQQIPRPPPHFPQRLKKKTEDGKLLKFISMFWQLSVNIPLVEALEQMSGYLRFMKDLVTKKRAASFELEYNVHHCRTIAIRSMVQKKEDPGAFTIPCTIGAFEFAKALCDLGASIILCH